VTASEEPGSSQPFSSASPSHSFRPHNIHKFFFFTAEYPTSLNCSQPSGASETMTYPIGIYVVRMEVTGEEGDGDDEGGKLGSTWLLRSGHQTRLKPFQATFQFWMVVCHQGDTGRIYHSNTASDGVKQLGHLCGIHILKCLFYISHIIYVNVTRF